MIKEFGDRAVVVDDNGVMIRQLKSPNVSEKGKWKSVADFLSYCTKKEATQAAKTMGFTANCVEQINAPMGFKPWVIKYDPRMNYYLACWE